jgi:acetyl-CoA carboxylase biotin carboxyl carrier protein
MHDAGVVSLDVRIGRARLAVKTSAGTHAVVGTHGTGDPSNFIEDDLHAILSPLSGVAYLSPGPDQAPYVGVGDVVRAGQVVALIEAMKVFNEIHADRGGRVVRFGVASGDVVGADTPLIYLEPDNSPLGVDA